MNSRKFKTSLLNEHFYQLLNISWLIKASKRIKIFLDDLHFSSRIRLCKFRVIFDPITEVGLPSHHYLPKWDQKFKPRKNVLEVRKVA